MTARIHKIVAIGGGEIARRIKAVDGQYTTETSAIDTRILQLTNKTTATLLFIPTASDDSRQYYDTAKEHFREIGFASVDVLFLSDTSLTKAHIRKAILSHDAIYVGGGNTQKMMIVWQELGIDIILKEALDQGIVLSGISAGSICWFNQGVSDYEQSTNNRQKFVEVNALGFIDAVHCPHYDVDPHRQAEVKKIMMHSSKVAICLDNYTAIEIIGDEYRIIKTKQRAQAHKAYWKNGDYFVEEIAVGDTLKSLSSLLAK